MEARPRPAKTKRETDATELGLFPLIIGALACALVFFVPFVPDEKITRLKLIGLELGILILLAVVGVRVILQKSLKPTPVCLAVTCWVVVTILFWSFSPEKSLATPELRRVLLAGGAFFAFALAGFDAAWKRRVFICWFFAGSVLSVYALLQLNGGVGVIMVPQMGRVMATYGNPIFFAAFLLPTIFISIDLFSSEKKFKALYLVGMALQLTALYFTQTRAAWLALIGAGTLGFVFRAGRKIPAYVWLLGIVGGGLFFLKTQAMWQRDQGHLLIWRDTYRMWKDHPVAGVGLGAFHTNFQSYAQQDLKSKWPEGKFIVNEAHNEYLQTFAETGIIGLLAFLVIPFLFFFRRDEWSWPVFGLIAMFVQNLFSVDMRFNISFATCFMLMGILSSPNVSIGDLSHESPRRENNRGSRLRIAGATLWCMLLVFAVPHILRPYQAQKQVAAQVDFFDARLLDPAKTIDDMEKLREQYPDEPAVLEKLAYVYAKEIQTRDKHINTGMATKAASAYQALIAADPQRVSAYNNLANIYYVTGRTDEALTTWRKAAEINPAFIDAQLNLGKILYAQGKLKEAVPRFEAVLRTDPNNAEAIVYMKRMVE